MSERDFGCNMCGYKDTGTSQPYQCPICGEQTFKYMTSSGTLHKKLW